MGIKSAPFGYLEFSCSFGGNHAHMRARRRSQRWCVLDPVLFGRGHTGAGGSQVLDADPPTT